MAVGVREVSQSIGFRSEAEVQKYLASMSAREVRVRGKAGETPLPAGAVRFRAASGPYLDVFWREAKIEVLLKCVCG